MSRLIFLAAVAILCAGCPSRWQSLDQVERAAPVLQTFYQQYPDAILTGIQAVPSAKNPERYRLIFNDLRVGADFSVIASPTGRLGEPQRIRPEMD